jgi:hypothetical protein
MSESPFAPALENIKEIVAEPIPVPPTWKEDVKTFAKAATVLIAFSTVITVGSDQLSKVIINWLDKRHSA